MQISPASNSDPSEDNSVRALAVCEPCKVAPPYLAGGSAAELLEGRSEAGGLVLKAYASSERIAKPGVDEGTTATPRLVEGCPSTAGTNTGVGEVVPPPPTPVL